MTGALAPNGSNAPLQQIFRLAKENNSELDDARSCKAWARAVSSSLSELGAAGGITAP